VLLPASALLHLSPNALEAILAHELAHIRRHDFVANLVQSIVEVLFFYHPATWWLSDQMRELREYCCDDAASRLCGGPASYASALASLEALRACPPQLAPAAKGASLMKRIQRLLGVSIPAVSGLRTGLVAAATASFLGAAALVAIPVDEGQRNEGRKMLFKNGDKTLQVQMKGKVDLNSAAKSAELLDDGAALALIETENGNTRRFTMSKEGGVVRKTYSVNGQERHIDADAQSWIRDKVNEIGTSEVRGIEIDLDQSNVVVEIGEDGVDRKVVFKQLFQGIGAPEAGTGIQGIAFGGKALKRFGRLDESRVREIIDQKDPALLRETLLSLGFDIDPKDFDPKGKQVIIIGPDGQPLDADFDIDLDNLHGDIRVIHTVGRDQSFPAVITMRDSGTSGGEESDHDRKTRLELEREGLQKRLNRVQAELDAMK
jgi:hypothetical protein